MSLSYLATSLQVSTVARTAKDEPADTVPQHRHDYLLLVSATRRSVIQVHSLTRIP